MVEDAFDAGTAGNMTAGNAENIAEGYGSMAESLLAGRFCRDGVVAVEYVQGKGGGGDHLVLFVREGERVVTSEVSFRPFMIVSDKVLSGMPVEHERRSMEGDAPLNTRVYFANWKDCVSARKWLAASTGFSSSAPGSPYLWISDPVQLYLMDTGLTLFGGLDFSDVKRLQIDIECATAEGFEFCNADREEDQIIAIGLADSSGWKQALSIVEMDEAAMLRRMVELIVERDPDVIEGHNIFNFDLPYIKKRAKRNGVPLLIGRDGSAPYFRPSRFNVAERALSYERCEIFGRHIVDTLFLVHAYDVTSRALGGYGLKDAASHFGLSPEGRTYIEGSRISAVFKDDPDLILKYVLDDVYETGALAALLSRSNFVQAGLLPYSYQNVCVRGNATKIDSLMLREYMAADRAISLQDTARKFEGGYTDVFVKGVVHNVHHCDVRSLYPSLMLTRGIGPRSDKLGVFLRMLKALKDVRFKAKDMARRAETGSEAGYWDAAQSAFKILINSFYGYLGFSQGHFNDYDAAARVTREGRELLQSMIEWMRSRGAKPVEIDTDGIYFVPPGGSEDMGKEKKERFRGEFHKWLPEGIEVEFDGEYKGMFSYKMKNYALLTYDGEVIIKGGALRSRGLEPFQRDFMKDAIRLLLEDKEQMVPALKKEYESAIRESRWPIERLAKTEMLRDSPSVYRNKVEKGKRGRAAAYELALRSDREYRAGDQVSYYVTGTKKNVAVHEAAKLVGEAEEGCRDENVDFYIAKLDSLAGKFMFEDRQKEFEL